MSATPNVVIREITIEEVIFAKITKTHIAALIIKTWNAIREGKELKTLTWVQNGPKPQPFPTIL
jgi:hypothetical protein